MFCPSCGVESTNKTKFCKNCGTGLSQPGNTVEIHLPQPQVTGLFWAVGLFSLLGLIPTQVPLTIQTVREPVMSVTEHTTRTFNPPSESGPESK